MVLTFKDGFKNVAEYVTSHLSLVDRFNRYEIKDLIESDILPDFIVKH